MEIIRKGRKFEEIEKIDEKSPASHDSAGAVHDSSL